MLLIIFRQGVWLSLGPNQLGIKLSRTGLAKATLPKATQSIHLPMIMSMTVWYSAKTYFLYDVFHMSVP